MSLLPTAAWAAPGTALFGSGGGGSNFPSGITIGSNTLTPDTFGSGSVITGAFRSAQNTIGNSSTQGSQYLTSNSIIFTQLNSGQSFPFVLTDLSNATIAVQNINSIVGGSNTTESNNFYFPLDFTFRPDQATKGGGILGRFIWDAVDTGANNALLFGATSSNALIAATWPGQQAAALVITGETVNLASDNENFIFMDGKAGAIGSISTGVEFISGQNNLSSLTSPNLGRTANLDQLLSTFFGLYPGCFS